MIEKIFYNIFVLGTLISICILPLLIYLSKNKYKYNFKSLYKVFVSILLLLILPINTFNFSNVRKMARNQVINEVEIKEPEVKLESENIIIEIDEEISIKNNDFFKISQILPYIWLGGFVIYLLYNMITYCIFLKEQNKKCISSNNLKVEELINKLCNNNRISYRICENLSTPMTVGLFNKKIMLPKELIQNKECEIILKHELFHIQNKDIEYKFILLILNCIYWFNPIIYILRNQVDEILELNCDENVLQNESDSYRIEYAQTLLKQIEVNRNKQYKFSMSFASRRKNIMKRFSNILENTNKKSIISISVILILIILISILLMIFIPNINFAKIQNNLIGNTVELNQINEMEFKEPENENTVVSNEENTTVKKTKIVTAKKIDYENTPIEGISFINPLRDDYIIVSRFGKRENGIHTGIDLQTDEGKDIVSCADGTVIYSGYKGSYGKLIIIDHGNGVQTYYSHCRELFVSIGENVIQGQKIAEIGSTGNSTGPHLHLEVRINGIAKNPAIYISF